MFAQPTIGFISSYMPLPQTSQNGICATIIPNSSTAEIKLASFGRRKDKRRVLHSVLRSIQVSRTWVGTRFRLIKPSVSTIRSRSSFKELMSWILEIHSRRPDGMLNEPVLCVKSEWICCEFGYEEVEEGREGENIINQIKSYRSVPGSQESRARRRHDDDDDF